MFTIQSLLQAHGLDPKTVAIMLHTPRDVSKKPSLRRMLPYMVREQAAEFETYQSSHNQKVTATLQKRNHVASFVGMEDGTLLLAGVYQVKYVGQRAVEVLRSDQQILSLYSVYGAYGEVFDGTVQVLPWFELVLTNDLETLRGRLRIKAKKLTPTYVRLAENFEGEVIAIEREDALAAHAPDWKDFVVTASQLKTLPQSWASRLKEWRGVYLITDENGGGRYVGSAYGAENLFGRWRAHVAREKGVTVELGQRETAAFRFSILQLLHHDADAIDVQAAEANWKTRLHTQRYGLNKN